MTFEEFVVFEGWEVDTGLGHWVEDPTMRLRCHKGEEVAKEYKYNNKTNTNTGEGVSDIELQFQFIDVSFHESNIIYQLLITLKTKVPHNKGSVKLQIQIQIRMFARAVTL